MILEVSESQSECMKAIVYLTISKPTSHTTFYCFQQESWLLPSAVICSEFYNAKSFKWLFQSFQGWFINDLIVLGMLLAYVSLTTFKTNLSKSV
jgi:hypothetical protein